MVLLLAQVLEFCTVATAVPGSGIWGFLCYHQSHAEWVGCHLHDLIQPSFSFLVGVSLAFSIAKRQSRGDSVASMTKHSLLRSAALIVLGIAMLSVYRRQILWKFEDTLTQIGLGYCLLFAVALRGGKVRWAAFSLILLCTWLAFALYPLPGGDFDYDRAGVTADWLREYGLQGWEAHWQKNSNLAWRFDIWFLSLFPRNAPYVSPKGLTTLNFVPLLATMILGLIAGDILRTTEQPRDRLRWLVAAGLIGLVTGAGLGWTGICPIVKSLWTPSWVLFSGGWCLLFLAFFHYVVDIRGVRWAVFPLVVVGLNSITAYAMSHIYPAFAYGAIRRVLGEQPFQVLGPAYQPFLYGMAVLACYWLALYALYRGRWFVRI